MEESVNNNKPDNSGDIRNPDGTWKKGYCPSPGGKKRNPLKEYTLKQFNSWTDEEKQEFLNKVSPIDRWKMAEGNPPQETIIEGGERPIPLIQINAIPTNNSSPENTTPKEAN